MTNSKNERDASELDAPSHEMTDALTADVNAATPSCTEDVTESSIEGDSPALSSAHDAEPEVEAGDEDLAEDGTVHFSDDIPEASETGQDVSDDDLIPSAPTPVIDEAAPEDDPEARLQEERLTRLFESAVYGPGDERVGKVGQVYIDDQSQEPNWVTVKMGLFGTKEYFLPLDEAVLDGKRLMVPYSKETITNAPSTQIDQNLSPAEEDVLYNYYKVPGRMTNPAEVDGVVFPAGEAEPTGELSASTVTLNDDEALASEPAHEGQPSSYEELFGSDADASTREPSDETEVVTAQHLSAHDVDAEQDANSEADAVVDAERMQAVESQAAEAAPKHEAGDDFPSANEPLEVGDLFIDDEAGEAAAEEAHSADAGHEMPASRENHDDAVVNLDAFRRPE